MFMIWIFLRQPNLISFMVSLHVYLFSMAYHWTSLTMMFNVHVFFSLEEYLMWIKGKIKFWILMKCCEGQLKLVSSLCLVSGMSNGNELKMFKLSLKWSNLLEVLSFLFLFFMRFRYSSWVMMFHHLITAGVEGIGVVHAVELISRFGIVLEFIGKCHRVNMLLDWLCDDICYGIFVFYAKSDCKFVCLSMWGFSFWPI